MLFAPRLWPGDRAEDDRYVSAPVTYVSDAFFASLGVPLFAGVGIRPGNMADATVVLSRQLALELFGHADVVGERVRLRIGSNAEPETRRIAGVARDIRVRGFESEIGTAFYLPFAERPQSHVAFVIRLNRDPPASQRRFIASSTSGERETTTCRLCRE
ncbi:MAG: hypothetical protein ACREL7_13320 [Longimicrobiales bacterium]